jgi:hypothetical protein
MRALAAYCLISAVSACLLRRRLTCVQATAPPLSGEPLMSLNELKAWAEHKGLTVVDSEEWDELCATMAAFLAHRDDLDTEYRVMLGHE